MPQVRANGIDIEYESFGREGDPAVLLVMGFATPLDRLAGFALRRPGGERLSRHPVRQSRHRPVDPSCPARRAGPAGDDREARGRRVAGRALFARRHGRRRRRPARCARNRPRPCRRRLDGRHDRATGRDQSPGEGEKPRLDHVDHRPARPAAGQARGLRRDHDPAGEPEPRRPDRNRGSRWSRVIGSPGFPASDAELREIVARSVDRTPYDPVGDRRARWRPSSPRRRATTG